MAMSLGVNDVEFDATDAEIAATFVALADGRLSEEALAAWITGHVKKGK